MGRRCANCGHVICKGRLEALPDAMVCVACSDVRPKTEDDVELDGTSYDDLLSMATTPRGEQ